MDVRASGLARALYARLQDEEKGTSCYQADSHSGLSLAWHTLFPIAEWNGGFSLLQSCTLADTELRPQVSAPEACVAAQGSSGSWKAIDLWPAHAQFIPPPRVKVFLLEHIIWARAIKRACAYVYRNARQNTIEETSRKNQKSPVPPKNWVFPYRARTS